MNQRLRRRSAGSAAAALAAAWAERSRSDVRRATARIATDANVRRPYSVRAPSGRLDSPDRRRPRRRRRARSRGWWVQRTAFDHRPHRPTSPRRPATNPDPAATTWRGASPTRWPPQLGDSTTPPVESVADATLARPEVAALFARGPAATSTPGSSAQQTARCVIGAGPDRPRPSATPASRAAAAGDRSTCRRSTRSTRPAKRYRRDVTVRLVIARGARRSSACCIHPWRAGGARHRSASGCSRRACCRARRRLPGPGAGAAGARRQPVADARARRRQARPSARSSPCSSCWPGPASAARGRRGWPTCGRQRLPL